MLMLAAIFRLFGDLLAFVGPWCIEGVIDYAYLVKENSAKVGNGSLPGPDSVTYTPTNDTNMTLNVTDQDVSKVSIFIIG